MELRTHKGLSTWLVVLGVSGISCGTSDAPVRADDLFPETGTVGGRGGSAGAPDKDGGRAGQAGRPDAAIEEDVGCYLDASEERPPPKDAGFWQDIPMGSNCPPVPADGHHEPGTNCMKCHDGSQTPLRFLFAGTVYKYDLQNGASGVEFGVSAAGQTHVACSATNGNFWFVGDKALDWSSAMIRMRTSKGEARMLEVGSGSCNSCHSDMKKLMQP